MAKFFVRDDAAIKAACEKSLSEFIETYDHLKDSVDLPNIYKSIRSDAVKKAMKAGTSITLYNEGEANSPTVVRNNQSVKDKVEEKASKVDLTKEIAALHKEKINMPAALKSALDKKFKQNFDLKDIRKIHYKLLEK